MDGTVADDEDGPTEEDLKRLCAAEANGGLLAH